MNRKVKAEAFQASGGVEASRIQIMLNAGLCPVLFYLYSLAEQSMNHFPKISIIIPVKPQLKPSALTHLRGVNYPSHLLEVVVAEGRKPSRQRNLAAEESGGDILCFLDDDSQVDAGHLMSVAKHFVDPKVAAVGGPSLTPRSDSPLQQAFGLALASLFGGGGVRNRYRKAGSVRETDDRELILCNLCFRRDVFMAAGGFDERLYPNEENELMDRMKRGGQILIHDPSLAVYRSQRPTFRAFLRQLFGYGRGRAEQTLISGRLSLVSLIPSIFLLYLLALPLVPNSLFLVPLAAYGGLLLLFTSFEAIGGGRIKSGILLLPVFPALHLSYGAGMISGFLARRINNAQARGDIRLTVVKKFGADWPDDERI